MVPTFGSKTDMLPLAKPFQRGLSWFSWFINMCLPPQDEILASGADEHTPPPSSGQTPVATPPGNLSPAEEPGAPGLPGSEPGGKDLIHDIN